MSESITDPWAQKTAIDESDLLDYVFEVDSWDDESDQLRVDSYCVKPNFDTLNVDGFIQYLRNQFHLFAFPEEKRKDMSVPGIEAQEAAAPGSDPQTDGKLGELILFVLVEAVLDLPIVCHKLSLKQEPIQEVKGSDGLFFGTFRGVESLAIGEAKIVKRRSQAIASALDSTDRFHGKGGRAKKGHELNVAARTLSEDLTDEETEKILEAISPEPSPQRTIHPIFLGYQEDWLHEVQVEGDGPDDLQDSISERLKCMDIETTIKEKISDEYDDLEKRWVVFFLFPIEDVHQFKEELHQAIYPYS
jgi:hypothetical protein